MYSGALAYIDAVRPKVILVPKHVAGSVLGKRIQELSWHTDELTVCSRDNFSEAGGVEILARIATSPTAASKAEAHPVVMMALKCVVVYVEFSLEIRFQQHAIQVRWETADATVVIDQVSIKHLEVITYARAPPPAAGRSSDRSTTPRRESGRACCDARCSRRRTTLSR